jgi:hypothetical protein
VKHNPETQALTTRAIVIDTHNRLPLAASCSKIPRSQASLTRTSRRACQVPQPATPTQARKVKRGSD